MDSIKLAVWQIGDLARLEKVTSGTRATVARARRSLVHAIDAAGVAFVPIARARWDEAAERLAAAVAINRRVRDRLAEMLMLDAVCWLHRSRGAYDEVAGGGQAGRSAVRRSRLGGMGGRDARLDVARLGGGRTAAEVLTRGLAAGERVGARNEMVRCLGQLAWAPPARRSRSSEGARRRGRNICSSR